MSIEDLQIMSQAMDSIARLSVEIFRDQVWVGQCVFEGGQIVECYATQLGLSGPESDQILEAIGQAISAGQTSLNWRGQRFTWKSK